MKRFIPLIACLLPVTASSEEVDWNHYESSGIPPHGKYTEWIGFFLRMEKTGGICMGGKSSEFRHC
jgi:hypothetical protein